jgi:hypothetical protein
MVRKKPCSFVIFTNVVKLPNLQGKKQKLGVQVLVAQTWIETILM